MKSESRYTSEVDLDMIVPESTLLDYAAEKDKTETGLRLIVSLRTYGGPCDEVLGADIGVQG